MNPEVKIPHLCPRTGEGVATPEMPTDANILLAITMVNSCEEANGPCPDECELKKLAETGGALKRYRETFGG